MPARVRACVRACVLACVRQNLRLLSGWMVKGEAVGDFYWMGARVSWSSIRALYDKLNFAVGKGSPVTPLSAFPTVHRVVVGTEARCSSHDLRPHTDADTIGYHTVFPWGILPHSVLQPRTRSGDENNNNSNNSNNNNTTTAQQQQQQRQPQRRIGTRECV